jgi:hypothetical protein
MSRRLVAGTIVGATLLGLAPASYAADPELPRATCAKRVNDDPSDAIINYSPSGSTPLPLGGSIAAVDIRNVDVRLTATKLEVYLHATNLVTPAQMGQTDTEYNYLVTFTGNTHNFTFGFAEYNTAPPHSSLPKVDAEKRADSGSGTTNIFTGFTADLYDQLDYIVWTVDRSQVERNLGGPLVDGDQFTAIAAKTQVRSGAQRDADDTSKVTGDAATYTIGDDFCFGLPPATLSDLKTPTVQYTDAVPLSATLVDEKGTAVAGAPVEFEVAGEPHPVTGTTNDDGVATASFTPTQGAGRYAVTARFAGDDKNGKAKLAGTITVTSEVTTLGTPAVSRPSATTRAVTATLLDNDKPGHPLAGQKVTWYVNNKKISTLTTDSKGRTVLKGAKPGQTVQAKFAGVPGKYAASSSKPVKA